MVGHVVNRGRAIAGLLRSARGHYACNYDGAYGAAHDLGNDDYSATNDACNPSSEVRSNVGHYFVDGHNGF